jgi:hypothetical protein
LGLDTVSLWKSGHKLETKEDRLLFEADGRTVEDPADNGVSECDNLGCGGLASIGHGEDVFG